MRDAVIRIEPPPSLEPAELHAIEDAVGLLSGRVEWATKQDRGLRTAERERWWTFLATLLQRYAVGLLRLPGDGRTVIDGVRYLSDRGGAPAWCLWDASGRLAKLRVDSDPEVASRIADLLHEAARLDWACCARLIANGTYAVLKTWIVGEPLAKADTNARPMIVHQIGQELARLHGDDDGDVHLVCSADDFNTIITPTGQVAFVDLEAARRGNRWIDLIWSEELLCRSQEERVCLWDGYADISGRSRPSGSKLIEARHGFLEWLRDQLRRAYQRHPQNADISDDMRRVEEALAGERPFTRRY